MSRCTIDRIANTSNNSSPALTSVCNPIYGTPTHNNNLTSPSSRSISNSNSNSPALTSVCNAIYGTPTHNTSSPDSSTISSANLTSPSSRSIGNSNSPALNSVCNPTYGTPTHRSIVNDNSAISSINISEPLSVPNLSCLSSLSSSQITLTPPSSLPRVPNCTPFVQNYLNPHPMIQIYNTPQTYPPSYPQMYAHAQAGLYHGGNINFGGNRFAQI